MYGLLFRSLFLQRPTRHSTRSQDCNKKTHHFVVNSLLTCSVFCFCFFNSAFQVKSIAFQWSNTGGITFLHLIDRRERRPTYSRMRLITCSVSEGETGTLNCKCLHMESTPSRVSIHTRENKSMNVKKGHFRFDVKNIHQTILNSM